MRQVNPQGSFLKTAILLLRRFRLWVPVRYSLSRQHFLALFSMTHWRFWRKNLLSKWGPFQDFWGPKNPGLKPSLTRVVISHELGPRQLDDYLTAHKWHTLSLTHGRSSTFFLIFLALNRRDESTVTSTYMYYVWPTSKRQKYWSKLETMLFTNFFDCHLHFVDMYDLLGTIIWLLGN